MLGSDYVLECLVIGPYLTVITCISFPLFSNSYMGIGLSAQGVNMNRLPGTLASELQYC